MLQLPHHDNMILPSCSYRIRKTYKGQAYTAVTDYKPTQKKALKLMADELADLIRQRGYVYRGCPGNILKFLHRAQGALGIPRFKQKTCRGILCRVF